MAWLTVLGSGNVGSASTSANSFSSSEQSTSTFVYFVFLSTSDGLITQIHAGFLFLICRTNCTAEITWHIRFCCVSVSVMMCSRLACTKCKVLFFHKMSGSMCASHGIPKSSLHLQVLLLQSLRNLCTSQAAAEL